jgi:hypothetical protein
VPRLTDLHTRRAEARRRYAARHAADDPLPDPELVACHVALPAYLEPAAHLIPVPEAQPPTTAQVAYCIRNRDRGTMRAEDGDRGKLGSEV